MKRILITGANGLLGQKITELLSNFRNYALHLSSKDDRSVFDHERMTYLRLDTTSRQGVRDMVDQVEPEIIIHAAAVTNVDLCEKERELAWRTNVSSVENLIHAAKLVGARLLHFSTDYIFDGKNGPYDETARPNPLNYYGKTKLASENLLITSGIPYTIVRTMVLYGMGYGVKQNFALWLYNQLREGKSVRTVNDQIGNPTLADDVAYAVLKIMELERTGCYHVAGPDVVSRHEFALTLCRTFGFNKKLIIPVRTSDFRQPAQRPLRSGFITLKMETDLGIKASGIRQGLLMFKNQVTMQSEIVGDRGS